MNTSKYFKSFHISPIHNISGLSILIYLKFENMVIIIRNIKGVFGCTKRDHKKYNILEFIIYVIIVQIYKNF